MRCCWKARSGAGKSAFARAFLRALAGDPALEVPSPSFTLVQTYALPAGGRRITTTSTACSGPAELAELGWDEARGGLVLVEWPERWAGLRPAEALRCGWRRGWGRMERAAVCRGGTGG